MSTELHHHDRQPSNGCLHFSGSSLLWITNHPKSIKGMWPRRKGVVYIEGPPKATESRTADALASEGLVGAYVDMDEAEYRKLPLARTPADLKTNAGGMARELAAQDSDNSNDING